MEGALCALGKSSPNPFLSTLKYFRDEYEAHVKEKRCPALSCKELIAFYIDPAKCQACMTCAKKCPADAIIRRQEPDPHRRPGEVHEVRHLLRSLSPAFPCGDEDLRRACSASCP